MKNSKQLLYYSIVLSSIVSIFGVANALDYDAMATDLANSIYTQILNDVPPPVEQTGTTNSGTITEVKDILSQYVGTLFTKSDNSFRLTSKALNARLNGGMLVKDAQDAVDFMYTEKLTKYNTIAAFQTETPLRRDEAAKFFSLFATQVAGKKEDATKNCTFKDLAEGHTDLQANVVTACKLGIFKGSNGMFNPTKSITNAEALTVLIRIVYGTMDETSTDHRAKSYWQKAQVYGLTQGTLIDSIKYLDKPISRGDMARLLEAARFIPAIKKDLGGEISYSLSSQGFVRVP